MAFKRRELKLFTEKTIIYLSEKNGSPNEREVRISVPK